MMYDLLYSAGFWMLRFLGVAVILVVFAAFCYWLDEKR